VASEGVTRVVRNGLGDAVEVAGELDSCELMGCVVTGLWMDTGLMRLRRRLLLSDSGSEGA
jgi:hypothetical protein